MGIRFACHHCNHSLHVKDFQAGKRGRCPECKGSFRIPNEDASHSLELIEQPDSAAEALSVEDNSRTFAPPEMGRTNNATSSEIELDFPSNSAIGSKLDDLQEKRAAELAAELLKPSRPAGTAASPSAHSLGIQETLLDSTTPNPISLAKKKREQKRKQQWKAIMILSALSLILLGILIAVLVFQSMESADGLNGESSPANRG
jgi:phage FluMu protein Com